MDSDESFMVYRRFGTVFARLLLNKQDEIAELENLLLRMDRADDCEDRTRCLMSRETDIAMPPDETKWPKARQEVLQELEAKVLEYSTSNYVRAWSSSILFEASLLTDSR